MEHVVTLEERYIRTGASLPTSSRTSQEGRRETRAGKISRVHASLGLRRKPMSVWKALKIAQRDYDAMSLSSTT